MGTNCFSVLTLRPTGRLLNLEDRTWLTCGALLRRRFLLPGLAGRYGLHSDTPAGSLSLQELPFPALAIGQAGCLKQSKNKPSHLHSAPAAEDTHTGLAYGRHYTPTNWSTSSSNTLSWLLSTLLYSLIFSSRTRVS